ncbi:FAD-dependent monooxygenase, partial [Streptomyces sp. TRM76130]|nr:FAD-dependent monooxygenase [Streptomyces sp. TRM76130]
MALQKAGFEPTVYEAYERNADGVGAFMNIAPNGLNALECLDLAQVVRETGFDTPAMAF